MNLLTSKLITLVIETSPQDFINNYYSLLTANIPIIPKKVNTERYRDKLKHTK